MASAFPSQEAAPDPSHPAAAAATRQHDNTRADVSRDDILDVLWQLDQQAAHDVPLSDLSSFATPNMRLSLSTRLDSVPHIAPFFDHGTFTSFLAEYMPRIPTALPPVVVQADHTPRTAFWHGAHFQTEYQDFSRHAGGFFCHHIDDVKQHNPNLAVGMYSLAPRPAWLNERISWGKQLDEGQCDQKGEVIWVAFGGFDADSLNGVIMSSCVSEEFMAGGGEGVVSKAELFGMLLQLGYRAWANELCSTKRPLPQMVVINFTDEYARIVQGALVAPRLESDSVELRVSVSANLRYVDEDTKRVIPDVWKQLLSWTFCRTVEAKRADGDAGADATSAAKEGAEKLVVSKVRDGQTYDDCDDGEAALRMASRSTVALSAARSRETRRTSSGGSSPASSPPSSED